MTTPLLFFFVLPCLSFLLLVSLKGNNDTFCICCCFFSFTSEDAHSKRKSMSRVCCTDSNEVVDKSSRSCRLRCCCTDAYKLYRVSIEKSQKVMKRRIVKIIDNRFSSSQDPPKGRSRTELYTLWDPFQSSPCRSRSVFFSIILISRWWWTLHCFSSADQITDTNKGWRGSSLRFININVALSLDSWEKSILVLQKWRSVLSESQWRK